MSRRVFACVSGGVVDEAIVPPQADGTWTVIDWDTSNLTRHANGVTSMRKIRSTSKSTIPTTAASIFHNSCATWEDVDDKHRHQFSSPIKRCVRSGLLGRSVLR